MTKDSSYKRRTFEITLTVHEDDFDRVADALLSVADLVDPGNVEMSAGPAREYDEWQPTHQSNEDGSVARLMYNDGDDALFENEAGDQFEDSLGRWKVMN